MGAASERRRQWRTGIALECELHRRTGKMMAATTVDIGPAGMRVHSDRPLAIDEVLGFELPGRARIHGRARVVREQGYHLYALRFEQLGDDARAEIATLQGG